MDPAPSIIQDTHIIEETIGIKEVLGMVNTKIGIIEILDMVTIHTDFQALTQCFLNIQRQHPTLIR
jgi:hypothetical protein